MRMRGQEPTVVCVYDEAGEDLGEILLEALRRFIQGELAGDAPAEAGCP